MQCEESGERRFDDTRRIDPRADDPEVVSKVGADGRQRDGQNIRRLDCRSVSGVRECGVVAGAEAALMLAAARVLRSGRFTVRRLRLGACAARVLRLSLVLPGVDSAPTDRPVHGEKQCEKERGEAPTTRNHGCHPYPASSRRARTWRLEPERALSFTIHRSKRSAGIGSSLVGRRHRTAHGG